MSSEIFYAKAFLRVGDRFIPVVNHGSSNCYDFDSRGREIPERHWSVLSYPFRGRLAFRQRKSSRSQPHLRKLTQKIAAGPVKAETVHLRWANSAAGYWPGSSPPTQ